MFINYQNVRNTIVGALLAVGAGFAAIFGFGGGDAKVKQPAPQPVAVAQRMTSEPRVVTPVEDPEIDRAAIPLVAPSVQPKTDAQRYAIAMKLAAAKADPSGTAKDILGGASKWKLNLYDDDLDGHYDRGKLDKDRNDIDDEQWTFKKGRWEKDSGRALWLGGRWVSDSGQAKPKPGQPAVSPNLSRYRAAMQIATARADRSGKGKDVLGDGSPWKLNLYDDNKDGQWDRAKLDTNRDDKDDEKWNFKKGRWEKDGGSTIWTGKDWQKT